jgi:sigma-B regulation protein RsbU (phosphoserine phosphatase)
MPETAAHLLVVDDNEMNRDMLSRRLERRGYEVICAEDGEKALARIAAESFDLVLLDIMMPGLDGWEVLKRIRAIHPATALPVIMATAKDQREDIVKALSEGANDYVTKPLDFPVVQARVETQLALKRSVDEIVSLKTALQRRNDDLEEANRRMKRDLESAARIQQALLPSAAPDIPGVGFSWVFQPCDELGGDILNLFRIGEAHVGLYVLDVSGHGVPAALLSVTLSRLLTPAPGQSSLVQRRVNGNGHVTPVSPGEVAAELNRRFPVGENCEQYFTLMYGVLDVKSRELRYVSAGHPGPVLQQGSSPARDLSRSGFPIGWVPEVAFDEQTLTLGPRDRLFLYSDGINEARNGQKELFGHERMIEAVEQSRSDRLEQSLARLVGQAREFSGGPFDDDVSALAVEIHS